MTLISSHPRTGGDLTPAEFARLPDPPLLIDVRSGVEYGVFHAPQARNLSLPRLLLGRFPLLQSWVLPPWFRALPKTEEIAVICLTAHRSPIAAEALTQAGFTTVFNLTGGMIAWQKAGLPVCKGPTSVTAAE
jgi:rhodanese-related sulfurtransferase